MTAISRVRLRRADEEHRRRGIEWWASLLVNGVDLRSITVRRTKRGEIRIRYPERRSRHGSPIPIARPASRSVRQAIEEAILCELEWVEERDR